MIVFKKVTKTYGDGHEAVRSLNLTVRHGELLSLIGPSGCGKTTTMKMINKLIEPTSGSIQVNGEDISAMDGVELRRSIGYVIQQIGLLPHMTVAENISLIPRLIGWQKERYEKRVDEMLELVGLDPTIYKDKYPLELSGGQQQRVGVVRALAAEPPIVLMDEPFSALDPISREQLQDELKILQQRIKKTIVFVTHDIDEALKISDRIAIMKEGNLIQVGAPEEILTNPASDFVREFIGENRLQERRITTIGELARKLGSSNRENMAEESLFLEEHLPLEKAVALLLEKNAASFTVVDGGKQPIAKMTANDLLRFYAGLDKEASYS